MQSETEVADACSNALLRMYTKKGDTKNGSTSVIDISSDDDETEAPSPHPAMQMMKKNREHIEMYKIESKKPDSKIPVIDSPDSILPNVSLTLSNIPKKIVVPSKINTSAHVSLFFIIKNLKRSFLALKISLNINKNVCKISNGYTQYSETSLILLNAGACKIYEVPITGQNELEWANCRVPDTPSLLAIDQPAATP